jgi:hypothetical protein
VGRVVRRTVRTRSDLKWGFMGAVPRIFRTWEMIGMIVGGGSGENGGG